MKVFNNYGAALTANDIIELYGKERGFQDAIDSDPAIQNIKMRRFIGSYFNRVTREFAAEVIAAAA